MPRRKVDTSYDDAIARLYAAFNEPDFKHMFMGLKQREDAKAKERGFWLLPEEDQHVEQDKARNAVIYYGLFYDLVVICQMFHLKWPEDGKALYAMLRAETQEELDRLTAKPLVCPPAEQWRAWRMAETGLGHPTNEERESSRGIPSRFRSKPHNASKGLTHTQIGKIEHTVERNVQNWIENCWAYLESGGDVQLAAGLAGFPHGDLQRVVESVEAIMLNRKNKIGNSS